MTTTTVATLQPGDEVTVDRDPLAGASYDSGLHRRRRLPLVPRACRQRPPQGWLGRRPGPHGRHEGVPRRPADAHMVRPGAGRQAGIRRHRGRCERCRACRDGDADRPRLQHLQGRALAFPAADEPRRPTGHVPARLRRRRRRSPSRVAPSSIAYERRREEIPGWATARPVPAGSPMGSRSRPCAVASGPATQGGPIRLLAVRRRPRRSPYLSSVAEEYLTLPHRCLGRLAHRATAGCTQAHERREHRGRFARSTAHRHRPDQSPSRITYAHKQGGSWKMEPVAGRSNLLAGIVVGPKDVVSIGYTGVRTASVTVSCASRTATPRPVSMSGPCAVAALDRPGCAGRGLRRVRHRPEGSTERPALGHAAGVARPATGHLAHPELEATLAGPGRARSSGRSARQWIGVAGDTTYLFYRSPDDATWMIVGTAAP